MWYYFLTIMLNRIKTVSKKTRYLILILFLSIGFLPLQNTAICIDNDGNTEFEYVDKNSGKCSEFNLAKLNESHDTDHMGSSDEHCGSCEDLILSSSSFIQKTFDINLNIIPTLLGHMDTYLLNGNEGRSFNYTNHKTAFNSSTVLSIKSVRILC